MTPTKNESMPELPAVDDPIIQMRMVVQTARANDALISRTWVSGWADQWEKERAAALTREAPTEAVRGDREFLKHIASVCRGTVELCEPKPQRTPDDDREHNGGLCLNALVGIAETIDLLTATPPAPQRMAQGELQVFQCPQCPTSVEYAGNSRPPCPRCDSTMELDATAKPTQPPHQDRGEVERQARDLLAKAYRDGGFPYAASVLLEGRTDSLDECALAALTAALTEAKQQDDDGWEANFRYLLERSPHTLRSREGGGPDNLLQSAILTFTRMEQLLAAKQQGTGEAESPSLKQTPAWWVGYSIGHTGRAPYHCIGPDEPPSHYMRDSVHWTPLYTAPQVEAKRQTGEGE